MALVYTKLVSGYRMLHIVTLIKNLSFFKKTLFFGHFLEIIDLNVRKCVDQYFLDYALLAPL